jgi:signal transduction histidine kinase
VKGLDRRGRCTDDVRTADRSGQALPRTRAPRRRAAPVAYAGLLLGMTPVALVVARAPAPLLALLVLLLPAALAVHLASRGAVEADAGRARAEAAASAARALAAERGRLVEVERALVRQLRENDRLRGDLLATVSHELRTPLTAILGTLSTLANRDPDLSQADREEFLAIAARQGERLKRLIEQLLLASRVEQAPAGDEARPRVEAGELVRQAGRAAQLCYPERHIDIAVHPGRLPVRAAPEAISQVVANLLDNAAKYSPAGTPIRLEAAAGTGLVVIAVTDAGAGVPPVDRERIFERFAQLDAGAARRAGGIGLGLWIARQLAGAQGGELLVAEAAGGAGARFELRLPRSEEPVAPAEPLQRACPRIGSSPVRARR